MKPNRIWVVEIFSLDRWYPTLSAYHKKRDATLERNKRIQTSLHLEYRVRAYVPEEEK